MRGEETIRYTRKWGRRMKVKRKRLTTPRNYEAFQAMPHLKDKALSGNSKKISKLIQKSCLPSTPLPDSLIWREKRSAVFWANLDCLTPTTSFKGSVKSKDQECIENMLLMKKLKVAGEKEWKHNKKNQVVANIRLNTTYIQFIIACFHSDYFVGLPNNLERKTFLNESTILIM